MRSWQRWRFVRESDAGPIVEFAIIVPVLLLLVFGVIDLAWAFNRRSALVTAAREGARFGAVLANPCSQNAEIKNRVIARLASGPTIPAASITVSAPGTATAGCTLATDTTVVVRIISDPNFRAITPFFQLLQRSISLRASAAFRWERG